MVIIGFKCAWTDPCNKPLAVGRVIVQWDRKKKQLNFFTPLTVSQKFKLTVSFVQNKGHERWS